MCLSYDSSSSPAGISGTCAGDCGNFPLHIHVASFLTFHEHESVSLTILSSWYSWSETPYLSLVHNTWFTAWLLLGIFSWFELAILDHIWNFSEHPLSLFLTSKCPTSNCPPFPVKLESYVPYVSANIYSNSFSFLIVWGDVGLYLYPVFPLTSHFHLFADLFLAVGTLFLLSPSLTALPHSRGRHDFQAEYKMPDEITKFWVRYANISMK